LAGGWAIFQGRIASMQINGKYLKR
jgi:hypothetical protein